VKIVVVGAGALGCVFAATLGGSGNETWLVSRSAERAAALGRDGVIVEDAAGSRVVPIRATALPAEVGWVDLVVVLVKSFDTAAAMTAALPVVGPHTLVMSLQNGLGNEDVLASIVGPDRLLAGRTYVGGVMPEPGRVRANVAGKATVIGELDRPAGPRVRAVAQCFTAAGLTTEAVDDIRAKMWDKLVVNVATGAITAITGLTYGQLYSEPALKPTSLAAVAEAMAVARAGGINLTLTAPEQAWTLAAKDLSPDFMTSMLQSVRGGRQTEIEVINGAVVRAGAGWGVPTPVNDTLVACVKGIERAMTDRRREHS
jgi:2-dehydropantoate 2-reductase